MQKPESTSCMARQKMPPPEVEENPQERLIRHQVSCRARHHERENRQGRQEIKYLGKKPGPLPDHSRDHDKRNEKSCGHPRGIRSCSRKRGLVCPGGWRMEEAEVEAGNDLAGYCHRASHFFCRGHGNGPGEGPV